MDLQDRIESFSELGRVLTDYLTAASDPRENQYLSLEQSLKEAETENPWFTRTNILYAMAEIARTLQRDMLERWLSSYPKKDLDPVSPKQVGVVMAGNIPLAGFHDFISTLISGHIFCGKLSSRDKILLKALSEILIKINPEFVPRINFVETTLPACDGYIATGSNNSQRYFEYYFSNRPHLFRKNRNGAGVLSGTETSQQLERLSDDVFLYFGLGCRSVSKIFVPRNMDFSILFNAFEKYSFVKDHHKYANNHAYYGAVLQMNRVPHLDNGFLLLKQDTSVSSPTGILYYDWYDHPEDLEGKLLAHKDNLQCIVSEMSLSQRTVPLGCSQKPELWEYADNVDTLIFLINLGKN
jgi:hypothetical protein